MSAVLLIVIASACFSGVDVTVKHLSERYPVPLLVWARMQRYHLDWAV